MEEDMNTDAIPSSDLEAIQAELTRHKPAMTTMNLVVWIDSDVKRDWVIERAMRVSEKHPSRTIILDSSPGRTGAFVRQQLTDDAGTAQNSRVEIGVAELSPSAACNLATSLLAPDVPTVLWWSADSLNEDTAASSTRPTRRSSIRRSVFATRRRSTSSPRSTRSTAASRSATSPGCAFIRGKTSSRSFLTIRFCGKNFSLSPS
jgi:hypothetical protein